MSDLAGIRVKALPGVGMVTGLAASTVTSGVASVTVGGITVSANVLRGVTLAIGDPVLIARQGSAWWVLGRTFTAAPTLDPANPPDEAPNPKPTIVRGQLVCAPVETRSYRSGKWRTDTDDVLQGNYGGYGNNTGCAFYGNKPRSLAGATVTSATIAVRRISGGTFSAQTTTLRLVTQKTRPAGAPSLTSTTTGPSLAVGSQTKKFTVPTAWAQSIVDGTAGGLAVYDADGAPYVRFAGRNGWASAFTLTINWQRST